MNFLNIIFKFLTIFTMMHLTDGISYCSYQELDKCIAQCKMQQCKQGYCTISHSDNKCGCILCDIKE